MKGVAQMKFNFSIEEEIYLNANANNGLEKDKKNVVRNLKLNYAIANDSMKAEIKPLIKFVENLSDADFNELISLMPFETGVPEDILHEESEIIAD